MYTVFRYTLKRMRGQIIGWGLGIAALGLIIVPFYDVFLDQQTEFMRMLENYPPEFMAFFGGDAAAIGTPAGYLGMYGFSMLPVIIGIFALTAGSGLIASDEESGRLDLILSYPISRTALYFGRFLAFAAATLLISVIGWFGFSVLLSTSSLGLSWGQMALPFLPVLAQALIYGAFALMLSMMLPARRMAAVIAGLVMVVGYVAASMSSLNEGLAAVGRVLPYAYFQGADALNGLDFAWLTGLLAVTLLLAAVGWWRFGAKDIRVGGEGGWHLPRFTRHKEPSIALQS